MGKENIPAPMALPAVIIIPDSKEGDCAVLILFFYGNLHVLMDLFEKSFLPTTFGLAVFLNKGKTSELNQEFFFNQILFLGEGWGSSKKLGRYLSHYLNMIRLLLLSL